MSLFTDYRDAIENQIGIGPDNNQNLTPTAVASAAVGVGRAVGTAVVGAGTTAKPPATPAQKVTQFVSTNKNTVLLLVAGALALFLVLKRRR